ncbi:putative kinetochore protein mis13 [Cladorrhinum sp. PSN332]|nr:putative kinetochore protein mis13 [Cladorrhinum sp. PSN332]
MTTLVRTRQPLQVLSMSNLPERRSKRLAGTSSPEPLFLSGAEQRKRTTTVENAFVVAPTPASASVSASAPAPGKKKRKKLDKDDDDADPFATTTTAPAVYDEQDGDFLFTRGSKRVKTAAPEPEPEPELEPVQETPPPPPRRAGRPPKNSSKKRIASSPPPPPAPEPKVARVAATPATTTRRTSKRKSSLAAAPAPPPVQDEEPTLPKPKGRRKGRESAADKKLRLQQQQEEEESEAQAQLMNGIPEEEEEEDEPAPEPLLPPPKSLPRPKAKPGQRSIQQQQQQQQRQEPPTPQAPQTIALPFSDTPIQNRNKEFRKKGGNTGGRRSSLGLRGRRASSLIDNGQTALPHNTVDPSEFWKYISAEGLSEPRRMKQLLIWCGERALSAKPRGNSTGGGKGGNSAVLGARAIQDQILKDFGSVSEFSDWFPREDDQQVSEKAAKPVKLEPNPINVQNDEKIAALEARIARLKSLKQSWASLLSNPLPVPPPIQETPSSSSSMMMMPDPQLLSREENEILTYLTNPVTHFGSFKRQVRSRLQNLQGELEYEVDLLADRVHKFDMRVRTGEKEAEAVLRVCSERLKEREEKEKRKVGTERVSVLEVLRSLGRVVGEGG